MKSALGFLLSLIIIAYSGYRYGKIELQREAVAAGHAKYGDSTGAFEWTEVPDEQLANNQKERERLQAELVAAEEKAKQQQAADAAKLQQAVDAEKLRQAELAAAQAKAQQQQAIDAEKLRQAELAAAQAKAQQQALDAERLRQASVDGQGAASARTGAPTLGTSMGNSSLNNPVIRSTTTTGKKHQR